MIHVTLKKSMGWLILPCLLQNYPCNLFEDDKLATIDRFHLAATNVCQLTRHHNSPMGIRKGFGSPSLAEQAE